MTCWLSVSLIKVLITVMRQRVQINDNLINSVSISDKCQCEGLADVDVRALQTFQQKLSISF